METTDRITVPVFENWYDIAEAATYNENGERGKIYLRFDPKAEEVTFRSDHPAINMTPEGEYHGRIRTYSAFVERGIVDARSVTEFLESDEAQALLRRIADGFSIEWNGSNRVGRLSDDAKTAEKHLRALLDARESFSAEGEGAVDYNETAIDAYPDSGFRDAGEWISTGSAEELGITPDMTDEDVDALAKEIYEEARHMGTILRGLERHIALRSEELREEV